jgi:cell division protein FtsX
VTFPETPAEPIVTEPGRAARSKKLLLVAVVVVSMLLGAGAATGAFLLFVPPGQPEHRFTVIVYLKATVTAAQKTTIQAALPSFKPTGGVAFETRQQAWRKLQDETKNEPSLLGGMKQENLPESFRLETKGRLFDCTGYTMVRHMPGVDKIQVIQQRMNGYAATITCDAEYDSP